jgi:hypothetical protein
MVVQGWFGRRRVEVPVEHLREIDHVRRRILVDGGAATLEPEGPLQRLMELRTDPPTRESAAAVPRVAGTRPVICGVTDGEVEAVLAVAARLARGLSAPLVLTPIAPSGSPSRLAAAPLDEEHLRRRDVPGADILVDALLSPTLAGVVVRRLVESGAGASQLAGLACREGAQLLVVGSAGTAALGGAAEERSSLPALDDLPCPVVVVPSRKQRSASPSLSSHKPRSCDAEE